MIIGGLLEEGHRPSFQRTLPIVDRISGAEDNDGDGRKNCQVF
jgi:hypothetical protein